MSSKSSSAETFKRLPGVLSFQRGIVITDGLFFNVHHDGHETPLRVIRHGIRGTQNINSEKATEVSNIQITETAKTDADSSELRIAFDMRFLPLTGALFACAGDEAGALRQQFNAFVVRAESSEGLMEVARRYARNILNARWVWRNRLLGSEITVTVRAGDEEIAKADAHSVPLHAFDNYSEVERNFGQLIGACLNGSDNRVLSVEARIAFGFGQGSVEVFPSQNYIQGKPSGFARPLYKVGHPEPLRTSDSPEGFSDIRYMGQAALRDQKISNALRTIDTWYPEFEEHGKPIPVEPHGANLDAMRFFRRDGDARKHSAFDLLRRIAQLDPDSDDGMYFIASLIRGGVFGESEKENKKAKGAKDAA